MKNTSYINSNTFEHHVCPIISLSILLLTPELMWNDARTFTGGS